MQHSHWHKNHSGVSGAQSHCSSTPIPPTGNRKSDKNRKKSLTMLAEQHTRSRYQKAVSAAATPSLVMLLTSTTSNCCLVTEAHLV